MGNWARDSDQIQYQTPPSQLIELNICFNCATIASVPPSGIEICCACAVRVYAHGESGLNSKGFELKNRFKVLFIR
jgi:hypothetical protein